MITIPLSKTGKQYAGKYETIIDDCDADLAGFNWSCAVQSHSICAVRNITNPDKKDVKIRLDGLILSRILGRPLHKNELVNHIDGNRLNNQRSNLRVITSYQIHMNRKRSPTNKVGFKGVVKKNNKYAANITVNKKRKWLGLFDTPEQAHAAYCEAAKEHFGEFANEG